MVTDCMSAFLFTFSLTHIVENYPRRPFGACQPTTHSTFLSARMVFYFNIFLSSYFAVRFLLISCWSPMLICSQTHLCKVASTYAIYAVTGYGELLVPSSLWKQLCELHVQRRLSGRFPSGITLHFKDSKQTHALFDNYCY